MEVAVPTKEQNIEMWGRDWPWDRDGDEFHQFATARGQDYEDWKAAMVGTFLLPYVASDRAVLEIGCGHGRWSSMLAGKVKKLYLCDIAPSCIEFCRRRFGDAATYILSGGDLGVIPDRSVDVVWCFDVVVHIEPEDVLTYMHEIRRVLRAGGLAVLHHANDDTKGGRRSKMTVAHTREFASISGLTLVEQTDTWGPDRQFSVELHGDIISTLLALG
jgi:ubiquinone/menaquinone biosynthesis C-methylase UbiE